MKKILALIVALALVFSVCAISVFADDEDVATEPTVISPAPDAETTVEETTAEETTAEETTAEETTVEETTGAEDVVIGDVNGDGVLDIIDVALTRAYIVGNEVPDYDFETFADVNGDGVVDIIDVVILRSAIVNNTPIEAPVSDDTDTETDAETTGAEDSETETTGDETTGDETTGEETTGEETTGAEDSEVESDVEEDDTIVIFEGEVEAPANWGDAEVVDLQNADFVIEEGGTLTLTFVRGENAQFKIATKVGDDWIWTEFLMGDYNETAGYYNPIDATDDTMTFEVTPDIAAAFVGAKQIAIVGQNITITGITYTAPTVLEA